MYVCVHDCVCVCVSRCMCFGAFDSVLLAYVWVVRACYVNSRLKYVCTCVCVYECVYNYIYIYIYIHRDIYCIYIYIYLYVSMCVYVRQLMTDNTGLKIHAHISTCYFSMQDSSIIETNYTYKHALSCAYKPMLWWQSIESITAGGEQNKQIYPRISTKLLSSSHEVCSVYFAI